MLPGVFVRVERAELGGEMIVLLQNHADDQLKVLEVLGSALLEHPGTGGEVHELDPALERDA